MPLDWDIKLDTVSIKDEIVSFDLRAVKGSYVKELTLFSADVNFYDQFVYTELPTARVEVLTKVDVSWVSQGMFFIEKPVLIVNQDSTTSPGVWGRSETAKLGPPFAQKVSKNYDEDTTFNDVINEMAALCGITISSEIDNYAIFANTYVINERYPIDVISELAEFAAGYVLCNFDNELIIKSDIFHPVTEVHTFTDVDIADISEKVDIPEFGNRIRISALGGIGSGNTVSLIALDDGDCLAADGEAIGILLAFVTDSNNEPIPDNTMVEWSIDEGASLTHSQTNTGNYLLTNRKHKALNYHSVEVDFPIVDVVGIWAYADMGNRRNYWNADTDSFEDNLITLETTLAFCDQAIRVTYITGGCAVNSVIAGYNVVDVDVIADVEGATDTLTIRLGNTCACGSSLDTRKNPSDAICLGNLANILVWATINNAPAVGYPVFLRQESGCGELSSENKMLKTANILNEASFIRNEITGVSQVDTAIIPVSDINPKVYLKSDTAKAINLYSSHSGKLIDLTTVQITGQEVVIDYTADGATLVAWRTLDATKDCEAKIVVTMADGTEAGLRQEITMNAKDCSVPDEIPEHYEDISDFDPDYDDQGGGGGGGFEDSGNDTDSEYEDGVYLDDCDVAILNSMLNADEASSDDVRDGHRFSASSEANCPPEGEDFGCSCSDLCDSEVERRGGTYESSQTIHEVVSETYEKGTAEYNEAFEVEKQSQLDACAETCEEKREAVCGECEVLNAGEDMVLAPGESMEIFCPDGNSQIITMPEDACGTQQFTIGCCSFGVRSTDGIWRVVESHGALSVEDRFCVCNDYEVLCTNCYITAYSNGGGRKTNAVARCTGDVIYPPDVPVYCTPEYSCRSVHATIDCGIFGISAATYEWQCI